MATVTRDSTVHVEAPVGADVDDVDRSPPVATSGWRRPSLDAVILLFMVAVAVHVGIAPLSDNSFLTHLATGRLIFDGGVPTADPYTYTAAGEPWVVQSWLASVIYAGLERSVGLIGIRVFTATLTVTLTLLLWRLSRPATSVTARLLVGGLVVFVGFGLWSERPLLIGAVLLATVLLAADGRLDPRWLVPVLWVWVNTHGSFPFALVILGVLGVGRWLDERRFPHVEVRAFAWASLGTLAGAVGAIGPAILIFPVRLLTETEAFEAVVEWQAPTWDSLYQQVFAVQLVLTVVMVLWRDRRWRTVLPIVVFGGLAVTSARNILPASIVLTPLLAGALGGLGSIDGSRRPRLARPLAAALVGLVAATALSGLARPDTAFDRYPVEAAAWMRDQDLLDLDDRVVHRDFVGNYLAYRYGPGEVRTFVDDRVDMFPITVIRDQLELFDDEGDHQGVLDRADATSVLWHVDSELGRWLRDQDEARGPWRIAYEDDEWLVALPSSS